MANPIPEWVRAFCGDPDDPRGDLAAPHAMTWNGAPALGATDGHRGVVVPGEFDAAPFAKLGESFAGIITSALAYPARAVRLSALRDFAGVIPEPETCKACDGRGVTTCDECDGDGTDECECTKCGDVHDGECDACDGTGTIPCDGCMRGVRLEREPVEIGADVYNRWVLAQIVRALPTPADDAPLRWHQQAPKSNTSYPAAIAGDGWVVVIMPLLRSSVTQMRGAFLAWEQEQAA